MKQKSIHSIEVKKLNGEPVKLDHYKGKVLLIVNIASKCGFTPQLEGLERLYATYKNQDFEVLAFPSNDFLGQEPLEGQAIQDFCELNYNATYPIFEKTRVLGKEATPLFQFLSSKEQNGRFNARPKWNYQKYLINQSGELVNFFYSFTKPESSKIKNEIEQLLKVTAVA